LIKNKTFNKSITSFWYKDSEVMIGEYANCNLGRIQYNLPTLRERIDLRIVSPNENSYFTKLLKSI